MKKIIQNIIFLMIVILCKATNAADVDANKASNNSSNTPILACKVYAEKFINGEELSAENFINQIESSSNTIKAFRRMQIATDQSYRSSEKEIQAINAIIHKTLSFQTSYFQYPTITRANELKKIILKLIETQFLNSIYPNDGDERYPHSWMLAIFLHSFDTLKKREALTEKEIKFISTDIEKRFQLLKYGEKGQSWFGMRDCKIGRSVGSCANHTYYEHYIKTLYGYVFNKEEYFRSGEQIFKFAIDDAKSDIGLWREASRGWWAWKYMAIGLTDLASIADIYLKKEINLYEYRSNISNLTYEDLVKSYVNAIKNPALLYPYSKQNIGLIGRENDIANPFYLNKVLSSDFPEESNWYYLYKNYARENSAVNDYSKLAKGLMFISKYHLNVGFNPQCSYGEGTISSKIKNEEQIKKVELIFQPRNFSTNSSEQKTRDVEIKKFSIDTIFESKHFIKYKLSYAKKNNIENIEGSESVDLIADFDSTISVEEAKIKQVRLILPSEFLNQSELKSASACDESTVKIGSDGSIEYWLFLGAMDVANECAISTMKLKSREHARDILFTVSKILREHGSEMSKKFDALQHFGRRL